MRVLGLLLWGASVIAPPVAVAQGLPGDDAYGLAAAPLADRGRLKPISANDASLGQTWLSANGAVEVVVPSNARPTVLNGGGMLDVAYPGNRACRYATGRTPAGSLVYSLSQYQAAARDLTLSLALPQMTLMGEPLRFNIKPGKKPFETPLARFQAPDGSGQAWTMVVATAAGGVQATCVGSWTEAQVRFTLENSLEIAAGGLERPAGAVEANAPRPSPRVGSPPAAPVVARAAPPAAAAAPSLSRAPRGFEAFLRIWAARMRDARDEQRPGGPDAAYTLAEQDIGAPLKAYRILFPGRPRCDAEGRCTTLIAAPGADCSFTLIRQVAGSAVVVARALGIEAAAGGETGTAVGVDSFQLLGNPRVGATLKMLPDGRVDYQLSDIPSFVRFAVQSAPAPVLDRMKAAADAISDPANAAPEPISLPITFKASEAPWLRAQAERLAAAGCTGPLRIE